MGLFVTIYEWFFEFLFMGIDSLPAVVQGIVPELCTLLSVFSVCCVVLIPCWFLLSLFRIVWSFGKI